VAGNPGAVPRQAGAGGMTKGRAAIRAEIRCWFEAKRKPAAAKASMFGSIDGRAKSPSPSRQGPCTSSEAGIR
jgi:hypothetical protein